MRPSSPSCVKTNRPPLARRASSRTVRGEHPSLEAASRATISVRSDTLAPGIGEGGGNLPESAELQRSRDGNPRATARREHEGDACGSCRRRGEFASTRAAGRFAPRRQLRLLLRCTSTRLLHQQQEQSQRCDGHSRTREAILPSRSAVRWSRHAFAVLEAWQGVFLKTPGCPPGCVGC